MAGEHIELTGVVREVLVCGKFRVEVNLGGDSAHFLDIPMSGKMKHNRNSGRQIVLIEGDDVHVKISPYDMKGGFITGRVKTEADVAYAKAKFAEKK